MTPRPSPLWVSWTTSTSFPSTVVVRGVVEEEVPRAAEEVTAHARREEVDVLRVVHRDPRRLVGDLLVDLGPDLVGGLRVRDPDLAGVIQLRLAVALARLGGV